jgi:hypothetical protein
LAVFLAEAEHARDGQAGQGQDDLAHAGQEDQQAQGRSRHDAYARMRGSPAPSRAGCFFHRGDPEMRIGVLRGRENTFPDAFIAKVNSMEKGVTAEYIQVGGTKLNEPVPIG